MKGFNQQRVSLTLFVIGLLATTVLLMFSGVRNAVSAFARTGYQAAFVSGVLYAASITSPLATVLFTKLQGVHPLVAGVVGGTGALLYDMLIFWISRRTLRERITTFMHDRFSSGLRLPRWVLISLGLIILASPLPDELAAGLFGISVMNYRLFIFLSFLLNTLGIVVILTIA